MLPAGRDCRLHSRGREHTPGGRRQVQNSHNHRQPGRGKALQKVDQGLHKIALRADIDALRMKEETHVSFKSVDDNHAHLLGHDGHTAILIATAELLNI